MKTSLIVGIIAVVLIVAVAGYFLITPNNTTNTMKDNGGTADTNIDNTGNENTNEISVDNIDAGDIDAGSAEYAKTESVVIKGFDYSPKELKIKAGTSVVWTNMDSVGHTVTSDTGNEIDSPLLKNGETYAKTFNNPGTYAYHCKPHPYMKGKIIVEG
ncbi:cupredoxin domain-containing protein [Candidatus Pacearchaeota archaeon]|nr:cupredoxin domain-containing protein [Candidatus Pacearchaeota archaeon]